MLRLESIANHQQETLNIYYRLSLQVTVGCPDVERWGRLG